MIEDIISKSIELLNITPYELALLTKIKYNFNLSNYDLFKLYMMKHKLLCYKLIRKIGKI